MERETFVGRKDELQQLQSLLKKKSASFVVVKGRRRIGKSRMLEEFSRNKKTYKITGLPPNEDTTKQEQLNEFARQFALATGLPEVSTDDWSKMFALLAHECKTGKIIVILDEISWIGSEDPNFLGKLKNAWDDQLKKNPNLMLIVCGSVSMWIDDNILNSKAFYGRITWTLELSPLPISDCNQLLLMQGFRGSTYEKLKLLSVTGGIPWYLELMQGNFSADDNIQRQCFSKGGALFDEFHKIFHDVFGKQDKMYKAIVEILAKGAATYKSVSEKTGYKSSGRLTKYLTDLEKAGFISKDTTWSIKSGHEGKISYYRLSDNYMRFYLKYIAPKYKLISKGQYKNRSLSSLSNWDTIIGLQFENLVLENRSQIADFLNIRAEDIVVDNPYIQRPSKSQQGCQIDYLIQTKAKNLYVCEIKFSRDSISSKVISDVRTKINRLKVPRGYSVLPVLIHISGVSNHVVESEYFYETIDFSEFL
ncbi:MAG: AAA family ATPase [Chlamydiales bacterium]|nr:AAA family ATPase [Chlamydiales bacterium]